MINGHGDDIHNFKIESNFSSNIYGKQDQTLLHDYLCSRLKDIHSYPEPDAHSLVEVLAAKYRVNTDNIIITNGATEAIYILAQAYRGSKTAIVIPTFSEYEDACSIHKHQLSFHQALDDIDSDTEMVWLCNPNNPNGKIYGINHLREIAEKMPKTVFVFDQSYTPFTEASVWDIAEARNHDNIILLHSMTKQFAIPGLRLGYVTASSHLIAKMNAYRMPWSVNSLAIAAGKYLLEDETQNRSFEEYIQESIALQNELSKIKGLSVIPSQMHYFLCKLENRKASDLKLWLIENYNILIRNADNFRGLDEHYFRIATQSSDENKILVQAIRQWLQ